MQKVFHVLAVFFLALAGIVLIALQMKLYGWIILFIGASITYFFCQKKFRNEIILLYISLGFLGFAQITTRVTGENVLAMGIPLLLAVIVPYLIGKYIYKSDLIQLTLHHGKSWEKKESIYILLTAIVTYLLLPFIMRVSESYLNWTVEPTTGYLLLFFIGINVVGAYDEIFFIGTVLHILRRHMPFLAANFTQSILFTSFLYELGFRSWAVGAIFVFAFLQGIVYQKTNSLSYTVTIHLTADVLLYLVLIHAYYPQLLPIFLIK